MKAWGAGMGTGHRVQAAGSEVGSARRVWSKITTRRGEMADVFPGAASARAVLTGLRQAPLPSYRRIRSADNTLGRRIGRRRVARPGGQTVMRLSRALPLALVLGILPLWPAAAQFGGMPGLPGSPGVSQGPA